jgi:hypothetical protein
LEAPGVHLDSIRCYNHIRISLRVQSGIV